MKKNILVLLIFMLALSPSVNAVIMGDPSVLVPYLEPPADSVAFKPEQIASARVQYRQVKRPLFEVDGRNYTDPKRPAKEIKEAYIPLKPGDAPLSISLKSLKPGLYSLFVYGTVASQGRTKLEQVWKPCAMGFNLKDSSEKIVTAGVMSLKQAFLPRRMQGFHMHINEAGDYTASFWITPTSQETAEIISVNLIDQLAGLPNIAVKISQNIEEGKAAKLQTLTPERKKRDENIWAALPPLNVNLEMHGAPKLFSTAPAAANLPVWETKAFVGKPPHYQIRFNFAPLDLVCVKTGETLTHEQVVSGVPWPGARPDDGTGIYLTKKEFPELKTDIYYSPRANLLSARAKFFLGCLGTWDYSSASLPKKYFEEGDPDVGHDAAMALVRLAYDWPALEMNLHELRLCNQNPDLEYGADWTNFRRKGKYFYEGWSGDMTMGLLNSYDQVFPYIQGNQLFADAVSRFISWIKKPEDVIRFLDRWLVFASARDFKRSLIRAAPVDDKIAEVLGPHPLTANFFDLTKSTVKIYPYEGTYEDLYATALSRCGAYNIGSFMVYAFGDAENTLQKADMMRRAKEKGVKPPMDLSDVNQYPRVRAAGDFMIDMFFAGGFPAMIGDASGGPHTGRTAVTCLTSQNGSKAAFNLWGDPRHAWVMANLQKNKSPDVIKAAESVTRDPIMHSVSRVVPDWIAVVEENSESDNPLEKTAMMMRLGYGVGHAHADFLDLNLFGMGLPLAVDLACRNEGENWSRPAASWSFMHNHAIVSPDAESKNALQKGEPWLRAFAPPLIRGRYSDAKGTEKLERDTVLMQDGDSDRYYTLDLQRVAGAGFHTWCFHGCESEDLKLNVAMSPVTDKKHPCVGRTLEGTQKTGKATDSVQAVWTMTRTAKEIPHTFNNGGMIKTVACEQAVLGKQYDPSLPPVNVRATLLGRAGDEVLQGSPFSQQYGYCFPFLWVQRAAGSVNDVTVYPAVYDWYRGETPVVKTAELLSKDNPVSIKVTTNSGQADIFAQSGDAFSVVSRDSQGLRWAHLSGGKELKDGELEIKADTAKYVTTVVGIDYARRTLSSKDPLPANPKVTIGSAGNHRYLDLKGSGTEFTFKDDLLIQEGVIQKALIKGNEQVEIETSPIFAHVGTGNRMLDGFTIVLKGTEWQFKGGKVLRKPSDATLTPDIFNNAKEGGYGKTKIYEIGLNDTVELLSDVDVRRTGKGYEVKANVKGEATIKGQKFAFGP